MFPAPVAPEQGTALSTTATEKIRPDKKLSGYSQPDYSSSDYHHIERARLRGYRVRLGQGNGFGSGCDSRGFGYQFGPQKEAIFGAK